MEHELRHTNKSTRRGRAIPAARTARLGAGVSTGIVGAMLLAGAAPVAVAAAGTPERSATHAAAAPREGTSAQFDATTGAGQECFPTFGECKQITEVLNPTSIAADGAATSTSTATATVESCSTTPGDTCTPSTPESTGQTVVFTSSDPGEKVGATTNNNDGTYTAVVTASTTVGQPTITATDTFPVPLDSSSMISATATLTQVRGPGAHLALVVLPNSIVANGMSTTTATATVTDAQGHPVAGDAVAFTSSDHAERITSTTDHGNGTYTVTITSSTTVEVAAITATDTSETPNLTGQAPLRQTAVPTPTVPVTGAGDEKELAGGAVLLTFGAGLLGGVAPWRRRIRRARG